jgi:hypothetical protein
LGSGDISLILLTWIGFSVVVGVAAFARGRDGLLWYVIAALISPPLAGIAVLDADLPGMRDRDCFAEITS